jgi:peptidyl-prolyl cis-trans isomerase D
MATLQKLRNRAGLLIGALGLALLAFILTDLFTSGNAWVNKFRDKAFTVDGETVSTQGYQDRVTEWEEFQKFISGNSSVDENTMTQIRERVYQQMVKELMLDKQAAKLGLSVSKEEMNDMVYGQSVSPVLTQLPIFMDENRQFSREALNNFLKFISSDGTGLNDEQKAYAAMYKSHWAFIERMMKYQRLEEKYSALLSGAVLVNSLETKQNFEDSKYTADISYVLQRYSSIPDTEVKVSDDEVKKLYETRKKNFKTNVDMAKVSYFVKEVVPSQEDYAAVEKDINQAREKLASSSNAANVVSEYSEVPFHDVFLSLNSLNGEEKAFAQSAAIGEIKGPIKNADSFRLFKMLEKTVAPDSVKVQVIVVPEAAGKASKADSVLNVIKGGKDFEAVAKELGQSNGQGGQWVTEAMLANAGDDLVKACFNTAKGEITKLVKNGQAQIIKVEDRTAPVSKVKIAFIQIPVVASDKTQNNIDNELNKFVTDFGSADKFAKAASEKGYNLIPDAMVTTSDVALGQVQGTRQVISWAFNEKEGTVKKFDFSDKRIIALINKKIKSGYAPMEEVSQILKAEIIKDKKAEKLIASLKSKNLKTLEEYAANMSSKVDTVRFVNFAANSLAGLGRESVLNIYSAHGQPNVVSGPLKGDNGVIALKVTNRIELPKQYNAKEIEQGLRQNNAYRIMYQSMEVLKDKLQVKDNRVKFF